MQPAETLPLEIRNSTNSLDARFRALDLEVMWFRMGVGGRAVKARFAHSVCHYTHECAYHEYMELDFEVIASELLRELRGRRSQRAFSRRLGYRTNIAYRWETARCFPTAAETLRIAARVGLDVKAAF